MELRNYWKLIKRRWLLLLIPAAVVLAIGLVTYQPPPPLYNVGVRFLVGQSPTAAAQLEDEERLATWQASEYVVNGLTDWVSGGRFADAVSAELAAQGISVPGIVIRNSLAVDNVRSMLQLSLTYTDTPTVAAMMDAAITVLQTQNADALPQLGGETAVVVPLDEPMINQIPAGLRSQLDLPLRVAVALGFGLALALLAEYLDPTIRDREEVQALGLDILGEIPRK